MVGDEELVIRVARARDEEAFGQLVSRFSLPAFRLAVRLCADVDLAEDAVQEAFLRIWAVAGQYRRGGNPRGWILSIVLREVRQEARSRMRRRVRDQRAGEARGDTLADRTDAGAWKNCDPSESLREGLALLSPEQREVVGLYYGSGRSQRQIGELLSISPRLVGYRLRCALARLRRHLVRVGLPAGLVGDREALLSARVEAPVDLSAGLVERMPRAKVARVLAGVGLGGALGLKLSVVAVVLLVLTVGWVWICGPGGADPEGGGAAVSSEQDGTRTTGPPVVVGGGGSEAGLADARMVCREWTFQRGPASDLEVLKGTFTWAGRKGLRAGWMVCSSGSETVVRLPICFSTQPFVVELQIPSAVETGEWMADAFAYGGGAGKEEYLVSRVWRQARVNIDPRRPRQVRIFFFDHQDAMVLDPLAADRRVRFVREYLPGGGLSGVAVVTQNVCLERIVARPVEAAELEEIRRLSGLMRATGKLIPRRVRPGYGIVWRKDDFGLR